MLTDQRLRSAIAGGSGGFVSWLLIEPLVAPRLQGVVGLSDLYRVDVLFGALAGICIGAALGNAEGLIVRSAYQARRGGLIGAGVGLVGGAIGLIVGETIYQPLVNDRRISGRNLIKAGWRVRFGEVEMWVAD